MSKLPPVTSSNQFDEFLHTTQLVTHKSVNQKKKKRNDMRNEKVYYESVVATYLVIFASTMRSLLTVMM